MARNVLATRGQDCMMESKFDDGENIASKGDGYAREMESNGY